MPFEFAWEKLGDDDDDEETIDEGDMPKQYGNRGLGGYQCLCGRFAKYLGGRHYYNGSFDCYSFDVDCSRCGVVTVECV